MPNVTSMLMNSESNTIDRDLALSGIKVFFALSVGIFKFRPRPSRLSTEDAVPKQVLLSPNSKISGENCTGFRTFTLWVITEDETVGTVRLNFSHKYDV